jgi:hypothetical protein
MVFPGPVPYYWARSRQRRQAKVSTMKKRTLLMGLMATLFPFPLRAQEQTRLVTDRLGGGAHRMMAELKLATVA